MSSGADNKEDGWTFLSWLQSTDGGQRLYTESGEIFPALQSTALGVASWRSDAVSATVALAACWRTTAEASSSNPATSHRTRWLASKWPMQDASPRAAREFTTAARAVPSFIREAFSMSKTAKSSGTPSPDSRYGIAVLLRRVGLDCTTAHAQGCP